MYPLNEMVGCPIAMNVRLPYAFDKVVARNCRTGQIISGGNRFGETPFFKVSFD